MEGKIRLAMPSQMPQSRGQLETAMFNILPTLTRFSLLSRHPKRRSYTRHPQKPIHCRFTLEQLEDRTTPATIDVTGAGAIAASTDLNVIVQHVDVPPTGTGLINPFLRVHQSNAE